MQYVRNLSESVSTAWNSINPATLSGAIDVIVVEQEDGTLACSPFHVRFGKFSLLRPYEKKVEFRVNGVKQDYSMKLGEGGEAFFVFETRDTIPQSLQTSPLVSPATSPRLLAQPSAVPALQEPELLELNAESGTRPQRPPPATLYPPAAEDGMLTPRSVSPELSGGISLAAKHSALRNKPYSDDILRHTARVQPDERSLEEGSSLDEAFRHRDRSNSPPPLPPNAALERAKTLSKELSAVNIPTHITETGDLMLDMTGYKNNDEDALRAEILARKVLSEELEGNYDIGALFGVDDRGNLWIYSSQDAKEAAMKRAMEATLRPQSTLALDAVSDPGYHSDGSDTTPSPGLQSHRRTESDVGQSALQTPPSSPGSPAAGDPNLNYAKTLRLTSDQLKALHLRPGENSMSFTVNKATCSAYMYLWRHETPVVISDIDGTITKSDALGHVFNMIGRDWTHPGVAKLYHDIAANGYNIMYLTSRSVGQADTTRAYLAGICQDGYRLPRGPTILSPDRTMAALRREVYLRKPHIFKMSTLRDIRSLYGPGRSPFYAGFGNRFTDQISYRTVDVPRNRIFTINSNAEVSLDLLSLNKLKLSYVNMSEVVDHYFPPVSTLVKGGGEEYTDFKYWRDPPLDPDEFSASEDEEDDSRIDEHDSQYGDDEDEEVDEEMVDSYISRNSIDEHAEGSLLSGSIEGDEHAMRSIAEEDDANDEVDDSDGDGDGDGDGEDNDSQEEAGNDHDVEVDLHEQHAKSLTSDRTRSNSTPVHDVNAELITGVKDLSLSKNPGT
ncbi:hypothetical protein VTK73DRAFT_2219 [Phialemonium thermophilum]|uniref:LNS2/PITP domain-containing protein n=1 Tax=Phialemonium thermophilum TaxID=223376 RepID=A0ABR3Y1H1_9PEZI